MMVYGYVRISTQDRIKCRSGKQLIDTQVQELKRMGADVVLYDMESGLNDDRKELNKLLDLVKENDIIISVEPSRITRSITGMVKILKLAEERKIKLELGTLKVDFTGDIIDPVSIAIMKLITVFSELEAELIKTRVKRGVYYARDVKGKKLGIPITNYEDIPQVFFYYLPKYQSDEINKSEFSRLTGLSYPSIYKYLSIVEKNDK